MRIFDITLALQPRGNAPWAGVDGLRALVSMAGLWWMSTASARRSARSRFVRPERRCADARL